MKQSKFTEAQVVYALKQAEASVPVDGLVRKYGCSTLSRENAWRSKLLDRYRRTP